MTLRRLGSPEDRTHAILRRAHAAQCDELARMSLEAPDELHPFLVESLNPHLPEGFDVVKHFTPDAARGSSASRSSRRATWPRHCARGRPRSSPSPSRRPPSRGRVGSGENLPADVVSATGSGLSAFGDVACTVDCSRPWRRRTPPWSSRRCGRRTPTGSSARGRTRGVSTPGTPCAHSTSCSSRVTGWGHAEEVELLREADLDDGTLVHR